MDNSDIGVFAFPLTVVDGNRAHSDASKDVQRVLMRVGNEIRHREEQSEQLRWRIHDLEHQLLDVRQNIEEYCEASALEGAALTWTTTLLHHLEVDWNKVKDKYLFPAVASYDENHEIIADGQTSISFIAAETAAAQTLLSSSEQSLTALEDECALFQNTFTSIAEKMELLSQSAVMIKEFKETAQAQKHALNTERLGMRQALSGLLEGLCMVQEDLMSTAMSQSSTSMTSGPWLYASLKDVNDKLREELQTQYSQCQRQLVSLKDALMEKKQALLSTTASVHHGLTRDIQHLADMCAHVHNELAVIAEEDNRVNKELYETAQVLEEAQDSHNREAIRLTDSEASAARWRELVEQRKYEVQQLIEERERQFETLCLKLKELKHLQMLLADHKSTLFQLENQRNACAEEVRVQLERSKQEHASAHNKLVHRQVQETEVLEELQQYHETLFFVAEDFRASALETADLQQRIADAETVQENARVYTQHYEEKSRAIVILDHTIAALHGQLRTAEQTKAERVAEAEEVALLLAEEKRLLESELQSNDHPNPQWTEEEENFLKEQFALRSQQIRQDADARLAMDMREVEACRQKIRDANIMETPHIAMLREEIKQLETELAAAEDSGGEIASDQMSKQQYSVAAAGGGHPSSKQSTPPSSRKRSKPEVSSQGKKMSQSKTAVEKQKPSAPKTDQTEAVTTDDDVSLASFDELFRGDL